MTIGVVSGSREAEPCSAKYKIKNTHEYYIFNFKRLMDYKIMFFTCMWHLNIPTNKVIVVVVVVPLLFGSLFKEIILYDNWFAVCKLLFLIVRIEHRNG